MRVFTLLSQGREGKKWATTTQFHPPPQVDVDDVPVVKLEGGCDEVNVGVKLRPTDITETTPKVCLSHYAKDIWSGSRQECPRIVVVVPHSM